MSKQINDVATAIAKKLHAKYLTANHIPREQVAKEVANELSKHLDVYSYTRRIEKYQLNKVIRPERYIMREEEYVKTDVANALVEDALHTETRPDGDSIAISASVVLLKPLKEQIK